MEASSGALPVDTLKENTIEYCTRMKKVSWHISLVMGLFLLGSCSTTSDNYHDGNMDFGSLKSVAIMPMANFSREQISSERVRDILIHKLLATEAVYVIPYGEVTRGIARAGIANPAMPSPEDVVKFSGIVRVDCVITGVIREYGELRSGTASGNMLSLSLQMMEAQTGKVVWSASATMGGVTMKNRLLGTTGKSMNAVTEKIVDDLIDKLFD